MLKAEQYKNLNETVRKITDSMIESKGYAYTAGYLQSLLVEIIDDYVTDDEDLSMLQIRLLEAVGVDAKLDHKKVS